eukprot:TRINITY_DN2101_c0_g2_i10.p1 TRINITY_DN2101_c0_g2~~TRINITY_DN2101_c0_g2_i10.p1  ORF type:complete len:709 (-),score=303.98 TRINITY_DN2101_c0_g2_i10:148-2274(-)
MAEEKYDEYDYKLEDGYSSDTETFDFTGRVVVKHGQDLHATNPDDPFAVEEAAAGVEFMAVRPWEGAIVAPDAPPPANPAEPDANLSIEWVYGYRCQGVRNNIGVDTRGRIIYPSAAVVIAYDPVNHTQSHFCSHTDDVLCLAQNPVNPNIVATGQKAYISKGRSQNPFLSVYNWSNGEEWKLPATHTRHIGACNFNRDGRLLASSANDNNYTIKVWDWQGRSELSSIGALNKVEVLHLAWSSTQDLEFCAVGQNTVGFYTVSDQGAISVKQGKFGTFPRQPFICVAYSQKGTCCVGAKDGSIYAFVGDTCKKRFEAVHSNPINTMISFGAGLITGSKDGVVISDNKLTTLHSFAVGAGSVRAVLPSGNDLYVGTSMGELWVIRHFESAQAHAECLVVGHHDGELWGLDVSNSNPNIFVTAGEDNKLMKWDASTHRLVKMGYISTQVAEKRRRDRRAATTSQEPVNRCARAVALSPNGEVIALGTNQGCVNIYNAADLSPMASVDLNQYGKPNNTIPENWIQDLKFNPSGSALAVATHGSVICLLSVPDFRYKAKLAAHNAPVLHLDWSLDGANIQSTCLAYELLFHNVTPNLTGSAQNTSASALKNVEWATQTLPFGWPVQGIFSGNQDGSDVNCVDRSNAKDIIATGDDFGMVNLYRYPALKGHAFKPFQGHSSHVVGVKFSADDTWLFSVGGGDKTVIQWRVNRA